jgi:putative ABC transport system substrate-binding protein
VDRRTWLFGAVGVLAAPSGAQAQRSGKAWRVGYVTQRPRPGPREEAFRQGLRELGWVPGRDLVVEERYSAREGADLDALVGELVRLPVDVLVTGGPTVTRSAKAATTMIPP